MTSLRHRLYQRLLHGPARPLAAALYDGVTALELAAVRRWDSLRPPTPPAPARLAEVTALIKTFERPRLLRRLVRSIHHHYPGLRIIIVDDSREPLRHLPGAEVVAMPYDVGLAAGRNEGLRHITTPLTWLLDDDFILFGGSRLDRALASMAAHPNIDVFGGRHIDLPWLSTPDYRRYAKPAIAAAHGIGGEFHVAGLPEYVLVPNFFVGRTERLREIGWNEELKLAEHTDFFRRAYGRLTVVYDEQFRCLHAPTPFDRRYALKRLDVARYQARFQELHFGAGPLDDQSGEGADFTGHAG